MKEHGTTSRYKAGCRCDDCRKANARAQNILRMRKGQPVIVDSAPALAHLQLCLKFGMGRDTIIARSGVSVTTIYRVKTGKKIHLKSLQRILAVKPEHRWLPTRGTLIRSRALVALGYTFQWQAHELGLKSHSLNLERENITPAKARRILDLCVRIGDTPGPDEQARKYAERKKWKPPIYYNEDDFYSLEWDGLTERQRRKKEQDAARRSERPPRGSEGEGPEVAAAS